MNYKDSSLKCVLIETGFNSLPKPIREGTSKMFWTKAIVLVKKYDLTTSYVIATRKADRLIRYIYDPGSCSPISGLLSVHPVNCINPTIYNERMSREDKEKLIIRYLGEDVKEKVKGMDEMELDRTAIELALSLEESTIRNADIAEEVTQTVVSETMKASEDVKDKTQHYMKTIEDDMDKDIEADIASTRKEEKPSNGKGKRNTRNKQ